MDWLEELAERRRKQSATYDDAETRIEAEGGGYEIELVGDGAGNPLISPVLVTAGDARGVYHI
jgi:hypothetical protein